MQESGNSANAALATVGSWAAALHLVASMTISRSNQWDWAHLCVLNAQGWLTLDCVSADRHGIPPAFGSLFSRVNCHGSRAHVCQIPRVMFGLGAGHPRIKPAGLRIAPELRQHANLVV